MKTIFLRVVADLILFFGIFLLPWWLWLLLCVVSVGYVDRQYEIIALGALGDSAYGGVASGGHTHMFLLGFCFVIVTLSIIIKPHLSIYSHLR